MVFDESHLTWDLRTLSLSGRRQAGIVLYTIYRNEPSIRFLQSLLQDLNDELAQMERIEHILPFRVRNSTGFRTNRSRIGLRGMHATSANAGGSTLINIGKPLLLPPRLLNPLLGH